MNVENHRFYDIAKGTWCCRFRKGRMSRVILLRLVARMDAEYSLKDVFGKGTYIFYDVAVAGAGAVAGAVGAG